MYDSSFAVPVKFCALICVMIGVFLTSNVLYCCLLTVVALIYIALQGKIRLLVSFLLFFLLLSILMYSIRFHGLHLVIFSEFYVIVFWSLLPIFIVAWDLLTTPPGELSSYFSKLKFPTPIIIGMLVIFRFFPTMKTEMKNLSLSMRNRRLTGIAQIVRHPVATCEYVMVPILLRCLQIADDLSVSAVARGAECPGIRSSYGEKKMSVKDWSCIAFWIVGVILLLVIGGVK